MSSKTKKKTSAPDAPVEGKKIKLPKSFITRPTSNSHTSVYLHGDIVQGLELSPGQFVRISKEGGADVLALVDIAKDAEDMNVVFIPKATRALAGLLLGDRVNIAKYAKQVAFAQTVKVRVKGPELDEKTVKSILTKAGVLHPGIVIAHENSAVKVVDITSNVSSVAAVSAKMAGLSITQENSDLFVSPPHLCIPTSVIETVNHDIDVSAYPRLP
ncbi:hypothetical protein OY671_006917, partial [Metschnikowia pulcherrima]